MTLKNLQETFKNVVLHGEMSTPLPIVENNLSAEARLSIYQRNTYRTLTEFLAVSYPKTFALLGPKQFQMLAHAFIPSYSPTHAILDDFAFPFEFFLKERSEIPFFIKTVAEFENKLRSILLAPMPPALRPKDLTAYATRDPETLCFSLHPTVALYDSAFAFQNFWSTLENDPKHYDEKPTKLLLHVVGLKAFFKPLAGGEWVFLKTLATGASIDLSLTKALTVDPAFDLEKKLSYAMKHGLFERVF